MITLQLQHEVHTRATPTQRAMDIAVMFGLSLDGTTTHTILPPIELTLGPGQVVFITGSSGGGKSTLLRRICEAMSKEGSGGRGRACEPPEQAGLNTSLAVRSGGSQAPPRPPKSPALICGDDLPELSNEALVDALARPEGDSHAATSPTTLPTEGLGDRTHARPTAEAGQPWHPAPATLEEVCHWLSMAGLNDAAVMLRKPDQLSEGQRHRLKLAQAMAIAQRQPAPWSVLLLDEFGSTLDRTTAFALARSVRRWVADAKVCLVCATTHDDLLEPLRPHILVEVAPGGQCQVHRRVV